MTRRTADPPAPPIDTEPVRLRPPRRSPLGSIIGHTGFNVARYFVTALFGALFPLLAGALVFGWRAVVSVIIVVGTTLLAGLVWRRIGMRGHPLRPAQLLWTALVLSLMLPPTLLHSTASNSPWPLLPAAGLLLVIVFWAFSGVASGRFHPAVVVYLLLAILYPSQRNPQLVLQRDRMLVGDLLDAPTTPEARATQLSWRRRVLVPGIDALRLHPAAEALPDFTRHQRAPDGTRVTLETELSDHLPPLEDFILGTVPGGIGVTSTIAVIIGGLFLLYRGLIDFRVPLLITASAWIALIALPIPAGIDNARQWFPGHTRGIGWELGLTLANYQVLASPLLFTAFFLAGSPLLRPLTRTGRAVYAILIGLLAAVFQMYLSLSLGSYLALLLAGLITPMLDRCICSRPLV